ncbi:DNA methyltransferase [Acetobacter estunensis]|uniref:DNA methyltransferase n=1 Tax=Acetobacter estunensis TaxID=104097 RepID=UPI001C2CF432|nr:DNA methyltransferase [Acetobacter estunensis]MBV1835719.1 hypothetical protein [Acetobacter estunensis]MBV1836020.1 hypothetical protein [Acetobacter estunensis]
MNTSAQDEMVRQGIAALTSPKPHGGLYSFHRYWGKKPAEPVRFLIELLSEPGDVVCDPFLGSGVTAREATSLGRRFVGGDLNPFSVKLSSFLVSPCAREAYRAELAQMEARLRPVIEASYGVTPKGAVSHLLWEDGMLSRIWMRPASTVRRVERVLVAEDVLLAVRYEGVTDPGARTLRMFDNARINAHSSLQWSDLFTGRALHNIRLLREAVADIAPPLREAFELTLTAAIGQMSRMVFAISGRKGTTGKTPDRLEVGSWTVGYWRPRRHFEINVWNCFASRAARLLRVLPHKVEPVVEAPLIRQTDALDLMKALPHSSIDLLITDPPHGDRIPYFELSELWNATLGLEAEMEREIVVSNARTRGKTTAAYVTDMSAVLETAAGRLKPGGAMVLFFNSLKKAEWEFLHRICAHTSLNFVGICPMRYSAGSLAQDSRAGSMKGDQVLILSRGPLRANKVACLQVMPGWRDGQPPE